MSLNRFACVISVALVALGHGSEFLGGRKDRVTEDNIQTSLLAEVEGTLGPGSALSRLRLMEDMLKPMYAALPKNEHGNLGHSTVRYALHRLFVMRHGWLIKGLGRHAESSASSATTQAGILKDHVPGYIQGVLEKRLGEKGLGLHELAVMAATMEHLIHQETVGKLGDVFNILEISVTDEMGEVQADEVLDTFMSLYTLGTSLANSTSRQIKAVVKDMSRILPAWKDTQAFVRRIRSNITSSPQHNSGVVPRFDFAALGKVVEVASEEFGTFQDLECRQLKGTLMEMEVRGTGRVRLADFYDYGSKSGSFKESVGYLRQLGALDETDPNDVSVVIPNYLHSQTNCIAGSGYYSVCCKDECEGLLGHLEETIASNEATPAAIAALVSSMPSSTMSNSRRLPSSLLKRLDDIAAEHGGMVPLHGRLFAQWMHHAYPRECPYPHVSGATSQQTPDEWLAETGMDSLASKEEMAQVTSAKIATSLAIEDDAESCLPWSHEEELLVARSSPIRPQSSSWFSSLRPFAVLALGGSSAFALLQHLQTVKKACTFETSNAKFIV